MVTVFINSKQQQNVIIIQKNSNKMEKNYKSPTLCMGDFIIHRAVKKYTNLRPLKLINLS